ncbi:MAG: porphobilinogen deaminase [Naasia sp.]|nr:porphobilinogen deaminase [Naasia sp.]
MTLRVGTRGSALALAQSGAVASRLAEAAGDDVELIPIASEGDLRSDSLSTIGGRGVFAATLRRALLEGRCDLVVHSLKDLPTVAEPGLTIAAVPEREDARDALCARDGLSLAQLPAGSRVGTGSPRRIAQLLRARPDLDVVDLRGNVDTRLRHVAEGRLDAVLLARAGLERLGRTEAVTDDLDLGGWPTAPGQGALALEVRDEDAGATTVGRAARALADAPAESRIAAERQVLRGLGAGCTAPVAVSSALEGDRLTLWAAVYRPDGSDAVLRRMEARIGSAPDAEELGDRLVAELLAGGAAGMAPLGAAS